MKLTSKGRYAVTAMLDVALHSKRGPVPLADISERQEISLSYLEQLFSRLRKEQLVDSVRGPGGGYLLGREASKIAIGEVIRAVDESIDATRCQGQADCQGGDRCANFFNDSQVLPADGHAFFRSSCSRAGLRQENSREAPHFSALQTQHRS